MLTDVSHIRDGLARRACQPVQKIVRVDPVQAFQLGRIRPTGSQLRDLVAPCGELWRPAAGETLAERLYEWLELRNCCAAAHDAVVELARIAVGGMDGATGGKAVCVSARLTDVQTAPEHEQQVGSGEGDVRPAVAVCTDQSYARGVSERQRVDSHQRAHNRDLEIIRQPAKLLDRSAHANPAA